MPTSFVSMEPSAPLAGAVRELWLLRDDGSMHSGLPKPYVELVVSLKGVHWWRATPGGREHRFAHSWVTPIQRGPRHARAVGARHLIGARIEPWAARRWLGVLPPGDGTPPPSLEALLGRDAERLRRTLLAAPTDEERFARFAAWLEAQAGLLQGRTALTHRPTFVHAAGLARQSECSPRTLRRIFAREAGLPPKTWLLLHRLDRVLRDPRLLDGSCSLAELAAEHGFADQAHMTRELNRLTGAPPGAFRQRPPEFPPHMLQPR